MSNSQSSSSETSIFEALQQSASAIFNTAGEDVLIVTWRWKHSDRAAVLERLRTLSSARVEEDALSISIHFTESEQSAAIEDAGDADADALSMLGRLGQSAAFASLTAHYLELTANSEKRAAQFSAEIERACGALLEPGVRKSCTLEEMQSN